jgi:hypothetical protein
MSDRAAEKALAAARKSKALLLELNSELELEKSKRFELEKEKLKLKREAKAALNTAEAARVDSAEANKKWKEAEAESRRLTARVRQLESTKAFSEAGEGEAKKAGKESVDSLKKRLRALTEAKKEVDEALERATRQAVLDRKSSRKANDALSSQLDEVNRAWEKDVAAKNRFRTQLAEQRDAVGAMQRVAFESQQSNQVLSRDLEVARQQLADREADLAAMEAKWKEADAARREAERSTRRRNDDETEKALELQRKLDMLMSRSQQRVGVEIELTAEKQAMAAEVEKLTENLQQAQREFAREKEAFAEEMARLQETAEEKIAEREAHARVLEDRRKKEASMLKTLKLDQAADADRTVKRLKDELEAIKKKLADEASAHDEEMITMQAGFVREKNLLTEQVAQKQRAIEMLEEENEELDRQRTNLERSMRRLRAEEASVTDELELERDDFAQRFRNASDNLKSVTEDLEETRASLAAREHEIQTLTAQLTAVRDGMDEALDAGARVKKTLEGQLTVAKEELKKERDLRWKAEKRVDELEEQVAELKWYFLPTEDQAEVKEKTAEEKETDEQKMERLRREQLKAELVGLREMLSAEKDLQKKRLPEIQQELISGLEALDPDAKEPHAEGLANLMAAMEMLNYTLKSKLIVSVLLTQGKAQPELMYELIEVAEFCMTKERVSALDSPEGIVNRVARDLGRRQRAGDHSINFNDALLETLVTMRMRRTGKSEEVARYEILENIHESDDEESEGDE